MFSKKIQKIFFKGMKVPPKTKWVKHAKSLGLWEPFCLPRKNTDLHGYCLHPHESMVECNCLHSHVVLFSHPISRKAKYFVTDSGRAQMYLKCGATVVSFDYNGFGESDSIDLFYWKDISTILALVKKKFPQKKVILHGMSFGAFHAIKPISFLPLGSTVILENVNKSLISYWRRWPITGLIVKCLEFFRVKAVTDMRVESVLAQLKRDDLNVKFIACGQDTLTTQQEMEELYSVLNTEKKAFVVFEGAPHLGAPSAETELYRQTITYGGCRLC